jgi:8-oxo-dGTP pyrophosphatase MutT (NUDIX family)
MQARHYLEALRQAVGKRPLIVAGACVIVRDSAERVLLHRRTDTGWWDLIGGSMEPGETFEQTARREVREEIGVELGDLEVVEIYSGQDFFHTYPNGDQVYHVGAAFQTRELRGRLRPDEREVAELRFFPLDGLPTPLKDSARHHLDRLRQRERSGSG